MREMLQTLWKALQRICVTVDKTVALVEKEVDIVAEEQELRLIEERGKRNLISIPAETNPAE